MRRVAAVMTVAMCASVLTVGPAQAEDRAGSFSSLAGTPVASVGSFFGNRGGFLLTPDDGFIGINGAITAFNPDGSMRWTISPDEGPSSGALGDNGTVLWTSEYFGPMRAYDVATGEELAQVEDGCRRRVATVDDQVWVVGFCSGAFDAKLFRLDLDTGMTEVATSGAVNSTVDILVVGDGELIAIGFHTDFSRIDLRTSPPTVTQGTLDQPPIRAAVVLGPDRRLVTATDNGEFGVHVWNADLTADTIIDPRGEAHAIAASPDGTLLATSSDDFVSIVTVWDTTTMQPIAAYRSAEGVARSAHAVAMSDTVLWFASWIDNAWRLHKVDLTTPPAMISLDVDDVTPEPHETVMFSGRVTSADGTPLANVEVVGFEYDSTPEAFALTTDADGRFEASAVIEDASGTVTYEFAVQGTRGWAASTVLAELHIAPRWSDFSFSVDVGDEPVDHGVAFSQRRFGDGMAELAVLSRDNVFADSLAGAPLAAYGPLLFTPTASLDARTREELRRVLPSGGEVVVLGGVNAISQTVVDQVTALGYRVTRLAGKNRQLTAIAIGDRVRAEFGVTDIVAFARADGPGSAAWADSVSGGAWASTYGIPILITSTQGLDPDVDAALVRWKPDQAVLFGGTSALSVDVETVVKARVGQDNVLRVSGPNRAATAVAIAQALVPWSGTSVIIEGNDVRSWTWGLAAASFAGDFAAPLLMSTFDRVAPETEAYLCSNGYEDIFVVGGDDTLISRAETARLDDRLC